MSDPRRQTPAEALHFQPEWCRVTLASIGDAVITTDTNGGVIMLNPAAQFLTGWTLEEATGVPLESVFRIINEESRQPVESPIVKALREGVIVGLANHSLLIAKDGTERPIDDSAAPIRNEQGEVTGIVLVFRDISERRRQERQVQEARAYAENIIATLREPFVVLDKSLRVQTANRSFYQAFHVSKEETENRFIYDLGNGQWNIPRLRTLLEEILRNNHYSCHDLEVEHDFPAIGKKIMLLNARRFESLGSRSDLILLSVEDITERRQAEDAVKTSELQYRRLFQTAKDGILILDAQTGKILDANPFMSELLGYEHDEFLGKELWQIGLFRDVESSRVAYRQLQEKGYVRYENLPLESRSGHKVEVEFVSNVYAVNHHLVAQCNIRDISDRIRLERQTKEQATTLADLHRRKDEFLAMLSHELRNPLAPLRSALQILRMPGVGGAVVEQAKDIMERQVEQMVRLVDDLLDVSRIMRDKIELRRERAELATVVARAVETARPVIDAHGHELTLSLPPEPLWLEADVIRLAQVVSNLLTNAAKYTDKGGRIGLTAGREGAEVVLRVKDSGIGIEPEVLPRIFDLFVQADRTHDRSQGGMGVGLSLVRKLVEMHGGSVEASSEGPGQGSEFVVRLPASARARHGDARGSVEGEAFPTSTSRLRILVVDDNRDAADSLALVLRLEGHDVWMAYDGPTALAVAQGQPLDVALLDLGMPGMDGYELCRRMRAQPALAGVLLVALTGWGQEEDRRHSQEAGFDRHLVKPVEPQSLHRLLTHPRLTGA